MNKQDSAPVTCYPQWKCVNCGKEHDDPKGSCNPVKGPGSCHSKKFVRFRSYQVREV